MRYWVHCPKCGAGTPYEGERKKLGYTCHSGGCGYEFQFRAEDEVK